MKWSNRISRLAGIDAKLRKTATRFGQVLAGLSVERVVLREVPRVASGVTLGQAADVLRRSPTRVIMVLGPENRVAVLDTEAMTRALHRYAPDTPVSLAALILPGGIEVYEKLDHALEKMQRSGLALLPVIEDGRPAGLITHEAIIHHASIESALAQSKQRSVTENRGYGDRDAPGRGYGWPRYGTLAGR